MWLYSYARNSPIVLRDPTGLQPELTPQQAQQMARALYDTFGTRYPIAWLLPTVRAIQVAAPIVRAGLNSPNPYVVAGTLLFVAGFVIGVYQGIHDPTNYLPGPVSFPPMSRGSVQAPAADPSTFMSLPPTPGANSSVQTPGMPSERMSVDPESGRPPELPVLDRSGKVHTFDKETPLPEPGDLTLDRYDRGELERFRDDLKTSIQTRIVKTTALGPKGNHGRRQGQEQRLVKRLDKILNE